MCASRPPNLVTAALAWNPVPAARAHEETIVEITGSGVTPPPRKALVVNDQDNVATCLAELRSGECVELRLGATTVSVTLPGDVPFGHKFALRAIAPGEDVLKYGEIIGVASSGIEPGEHVHVHNVESVRARGDRAGERGS